MMRKSLRAVSQRNIRSRLGSRSSIGGVDCHPLITRRLRLEVLEDRRLLSVSSLIDDAHRSPGGSDPNAARNHGAASVPGEILVAFDGGVAASFRTHGADKALEMAGQIVGSHGLNSGRVLFDAPTGNGYGERIVTHWQYGAGADVVEAVGRLEGVAYAELNGIMSIQTHDDANPQDPSFTDPPGWPFGVQEHLLHDPISREIHAEEAWDVSTGGDVDADGEAWGNGNANVIVAVVDSGVDLDHPDLDDNLYEIGGTIVAATCSNGCNSSGASNGNSNHGGDVHGNGKGGIPGPPGGGGGGGGGPAPGQDDAGHGTHVAGIISAEINNLIVGVDVDPAELASEADNDDWEGGTVGVAPRAKIMPVKVLGSNGSGPFADVAEGITFAAENGAHIISMSLGGGFSQAVSDAIFTAYSDGVLVISAAGNGNDEGSSHPASDPYSLSIAAVDSADVRASFSNYGFTTDIAAPGVDILSTFIDITDGSNESGTFTGAYGRISGTSMATPAASGVAALIWSLNPTWTPDQVAAQLLATAFNIDADNPGFVGKLGAGRIDASAAVGGATAPTVIAMQGLGTTDPTANATINRLDVGKTITVQFSHAMTSGSVLDIGKYTLTYAGSTPGFDDGDEFLVTLDVITQPLPPPPDLTDFSDLHDYYVPFPGRGVKLAVASDESIVNYGNNLPDGLYRFSVDALPDGSAVPLGYSHDFEIVPRQLTAEAVAPLGSQIYVAQESETIDGEGVGVGDKDNFEITVEDGLSVAASVISPTGAAASVLLAAGDTIGDDLPDTYLITVGDGDPGKYTLSVAINAEVDDESVSYVELDAASFIPLGSGAGSRAGVFGSLNSTPNTFDVEMLEDFELADLETDYTLIGKDPSNASIAESSAHDGTYGLEDQTNDGLGGWEVRDDAQTHVAAGDAISVWISSDGTAGRGYFAFGADDSKALSIQMGTNTGELLLGFHRNYKYKTIGASDQAWLANHWYRMEVLWETNGDITGHLYDSDGVTWLNTVTGNNTTVTEGGIGFRSFYSTRSFDTVQVITGGATSGKSFYDAEEGDAYKFSGDATVILTPIDGVVMSLEHRSALGDEWSPVGEGPYNAVDETNYVRVVGEADGDYTLLVNKNALFDGEKGNNTLAGAQDLSLTSAAYGHAGSAVVGYFTDFRTGTRSPEAAIILAGLTPLQITDIANFNFDTIDILMMNEAGNSGPSAELAAALPEIEIWVRAGGVLVTHDRFVANGTAFDSNPFLVGAQSIQVSRDLDEATSTDIDVIGVLADETLVTTGPHGDIDDTTLDGGSSSNHGFADGATVLAVGGVNILSAGPSENDVAAFSYPLDAGEVYYSTIPLDFYLSDGGPSEVSSNFRTIYAPNVLEYAFRGLSYDVDWYSLGALAEGGTIHLAVTAPGGAVGQFDNLLSPGLELYRDSDASLIDSGATVTAGMIEGGNYYVKVVALSDSGEYELEWSFTEPDLGGSFFPRSASVNIPGQSAPLETEVSQFPMQSGVNRFNSLSAAPDPRAVVTDRLMSRLATGRSDALAELGLDEQLESGLDDLLMDFLR